MGRHIFPLWSYQALKVRNNAGRLLAYSLFLTFYHAYEHLLMLPSIGKCHRYPHTESILGNYIDI